jgi:hypothetical protein
MGIRVSSDGNSGTLTIPGKAAWLVTGLMKVVVERLVNTHHVGPSHLITAVLHNGSGCSSLDGLFGRETVWCEYIEKVPITRAWLLRLWPLVPASPEDDESDVSDQPEGDEAAVEG